MQHGVDRMTPGGRTSDMTETRPFAELLAAAQAGEDAAMAQLVAQYEPDVRLVARLRLGAALRPHLDSLDIVQSVHRSLMVGLRGGRFDISSPEKLIALALTMVRRKVANHWRHLQRQQRLSGGDGERQNVVEVLASLQAKSDDPHELLAIRDAVQKLLAGVSPLERQLIELRLEGYSTVEAARKLDLDSDVLRVRLSRLRRRINELGILDDWL